MIRDRIDAPVQRGGRSVAHRLRMGFNAVLGAALDWLYPPRCLACDVEIAGLGPDGPRALCAGCWRETRFIAPPLCRRCGAPLAFEAPEPSGGASPAGCPACAGRPARWREARAAVLYGGPARALTLALKHGDRLEAARPMGRWMARAGAPLLAADQKGRRPWLAPVPLHWRRRLARRSNQSVELALSVSQTAGAPCAPDMLLRRRATPSLDGLSRPERAEALVGAIEVSRAWADRLQGARVVMVDDVLTTGATLNACAEALKAAGVERVDALVFARVERSLDPF